MAKNEQLWADALRELESPSRRLGLWAKAFAESGGSENAAKAAYLRERVQQLTEAAAEEAAEEAAEAEREAAEAEREAAEAERQAAITRRIEQPETERLKDLFLRGERPSPEAIAHLVEVSQSDTTIVALHDRVRGRRLLHWCAILDLQELAKTLIQNGADPSIRDLEGRSAFDSCKWEETRKSLSEAWNKREFQLMKRYKITRHLNGYMYRMWSFHSLDEAVAGAKIDLGERISGPMAGSARSKLNSMPSMASIGEPQTAATADREKSAARALTNGSEDSPAMLRTKWLKYWNYFSLPVGGLVGLSASVALPALGLILVPISALHFAVAFGLHHRKRWAWQWNWVLVVATYVSGAIPAPTLVTQTNSAGFWAQFLLYLAIFALIWMWPNYVYWRKRRVLFS